MDTNYNVISPRFLFSALSFLPLAAARPTDLRTYAVGQSGVIQNFTADQFTCPLNGRVKLQPSMIDSDILRQLIKDAEPEISVDEWRVTQCAEHIRDGNYTHMLSDPEFPHLVLAAYVTHQISCWNLFDASMWAESGKFRRQQSWDVIHYLWNPSSYMDQQLRVLPLLKQSGDWSDDITQAVDDEIARRHIGKIPRETLEAIRIRIQQLPSSEQTFAYWRNPDGTSNIPDLSLRAWQVLLRELSGHLTPLHVQFGAISPKTFLNAAVIGQRILPLPFPSLPMGDHLSSNIPTHLAWKALWIVSHAQAPLLTKTLGRLLYGMREISDDRESHDVQVMGQLLFNKLPTVLYLDQRELKNAEIHVALNHVFKLLETHEHDFQSTVWPWALALNLWEHGVSIGKIPALEKKHRLIQLSAQFLEGRSTLERVYLLQKLEDAAITDKTEIAQFYSTQPAVLLPALKPSDFPNTKRSENMLSYFYTFVKLGVITYLGRGILREIRDPNNPFFGPVRRELIAQGLLA
jgi:hypothetical protein